MTKAQDCMICHRWYTLGNQDLERILLMEPIGPISPKPKGGSAVLRMFDARNHYVVKRNDLIQSTRYNLTANEQKLILHLIQEISPENQTLTFKLDVHKYAKFIGVKDNRLNVSRIKRDLKKLNDKSFWIQRPPVNGHRHEQLVSWFAMIDHDETTNVFTLRFDDRLKPFLLKTKKFFTKYHYYYIMTMRGKYSIRLYEYFISYLSIQNNRRGFNYKLSTILHILDLEHTKSYKRFSNLNRRVLKPAIREINRLSNINIRMKQLKNGHSTYGVNILVTKKNKHDLYKTQGLIQHLLTSKEDYSK